MIPPLAEWHSKKVLRTGFMPWFCRPHLSEHAVYISSCSENLRATAAWSYLPQEANDLRCSGHTGGANRGKHAPVASSDDAKAWHAASAPDRGSAQSRTQYCPFA